MIFRALGSERRIEITVFCEKYWRSVAEVAEWLSISEEAASRHLHILKRAGILASRRTGKEVQYRLSKKWALRKILMFQYP